MNLRGLVPLACFGLASLGAPALAASPAVTISATNVTLNLSGFGASEFTVQSVDGFARTVTVQCAYSGPASQTKVPLCPMTPPAAYTLTAGASVKGSIAFYPYGSAVPAALWRPSSGTRVSPLAAGVAFAALVFGFGFRRRVWKVLALVAFASAVLTAITACGTGTGGMPSGTYPYTITTSAAGQPNNVTATTTITVTVP